MKNTLLFSTLVVSLALVGCNKSTRTRTASTTDTTSPTPAATTPSSTDTTATATTPSSTDTLGAKIDRATDRVADATRDAASAVNQAGRDMSAKMTEWRLNASDIESDVNSGRPVVRMSSMAPTGKIDKGNVEKTIKGKMAADAQLANYKFDVNANSKGEVELEGKVKTAEDIAHAMACALDTEGVAQVTSKIKLDPKAGK